MKYKNLNLLSDTTTSYDKTKTTLAGRTFVKSISGENAVGPSLTRFIDVQTDFSGLFVSSGLDCTTTNGRKFLISTITTGVGSVALYTFNFNTGAYVAVGRITFRLPSLAATTHTLRYVRVEDAGTTGWKIFLGSVGSVAVNGGAFVINKVDLADFTFNLTPTDFPMGIASDAKATYQLQAPVFMGALYNITTVMGAGINAAKELILTTGSAASVVHHGFNTLLAPTVVQYICTSPTVNGSPTFTLTSHGFSAGDQLVPIANTPGGFTQYTGIGAQLVYFVRATNLTANTFELSTTVGGAAINATSATTPTFVRAQGQVSNMYLASRNTGTITTGFSGTALLLDNQKIVTPADGPLAGFECFFFSTTTNFYLYKISDITSGAVLLPSSIGINILGSGNDITAPTAVAATYSEVLGKVIYSTAAFGFVMKNWVNNSIFKTFGTQINTWLENTGRLTDYFRGFVVSGIEVTNGWLFIVITTSGQRGVLCVDLRSDTSFDFSYLISPVTYVGPADFKFISTIEKLYELTDTVTLSYKTSDDYNDAIFSTASGPWTPIDVASDLSLNSLLSYIQVKANFDIATVLSGTPTQLVDILVGYIPKTEISDYWEGSVDNTTANGISPAHIAFRLTRAYPSGVVALTVEGYLDDGTLAYSKSTDTNFADFDKSTNNGTSWSVMSGANDYSNTALTTEIRLNPTGLPNDKITWRIKEK